MSENAAVANVGREADDLPRMPGPSLDDRRHAVTAGDPAHRPCAGGCDGDAVQYGVARAEARGRDHRPLRAVPAQRERRVRLTLHRPPHRPCGAGGLHRDVVQRIGVPEVRARHDGPRRAVPALDQRAEPRRRSVAPDRPHEGPGDGGDAGQPVLQGSGVRHRLSAPTPPVPGEDQSGPSLRPVRSFPPPRGRWRPLRRPAPSPSTPSSRSRWHARATTTAC